MAMGCPSDMPDLLYRDDQPSIVYSSPTTLPTVSTGGGGRGVAVVDPSPDPSHDYAQTTLQTHETTYAADTCTAAGGEEGIGFDTAHTWALGYELVGAMVQGDEVQGTDEDGDTEDLSEMPLFEHVQAAVKHDPEFRARFMRHTFSKVLHRDLYFCGDTRVLTFQNSSGFWKKSTSRVLKCRYTV
jgi:hypothetical protein